MVPARSSYRSALLAVVKANGLGCLEYVNLQTLEQDPFTLNQHVLLDEAVKKWQLAAHNLPQTESEIR